MLHSSFIVARYSTAVPDAPVGMPVQKVEALAQCAGEVNYTSDGRLPSGCLFGVPVLATKAKATVESIDASAALAMKGVEDFVSAADLKDIGATNSIGSEGYEIFAATTTTHVGQFLGMILADAQSIGERAATAVKVTYTAGVGGCQGHAANPAVVASMHDERRTVGHVFPDVVTKAATTPPSAATAATAPAPATSTATGAMTTSGQKHFYMETQTTLAEPGEKGTLLVTCACQAIGVLRGELASALAKLESKITVQNNRVGGAYGGKAFLYISIATATSAAALKVNRPVLCQLDRNTDMTALGGRVPASVVMSAGYNANSGQITALNIDAMVDGGYSKAGGNQVTSLNAYDIKGDHETPSSSSSFHLFFLFFWRGRVGSHEHAAAVFAVFHLIRGVAEITFPPLVLLTAVARFRRYEITSHDKGAKFSNKTVLTDTPCNTIMRAPGTYQGALFTEAAIEMVAANAQVDPAVVQKANMDAVVAPIMAALQKQAAVSDKKAAVAAFNAANQWRKRGLYCMPVHYTMNNSGFEESALVEVHSDGSVSVNNSGLEVGQ